MEEHHHSSSFHSTLWNKLTALARKKEQPSKDKNDNEGQGQGQGQDPWKTASGLNPSPSRDNSQELTLRHCQRRREEESASAEKKAAPPGARLLSVAYVGDCEVSVGVVDSQSGKFERSLEQSIHVGRSLELPPINGARAWNRDDRVIYFMGNKEEGSFLYRFDLQTGTLRASSHALDRGLPWTLAYDPRWPQHLWCFAVQPFVQSTLSLYQVEVETGKMRLVTNFDRQYSKLIRAGRDNYCGAYDAATSRFFLYLEKRRGKSKRHKQPEEAEEEQVRDREITADADVLMERKMSRALRLYRQLEEDPMLLIVDTDTLSTVEVPIRFSRLENVKLNTLESYVYSKRWNCLFGFASLTKEKCMVQQRLRMQFVRVEVATGTVTPLGPEWSDYKRAEDGLMALDEERGLLFTSIVSEWSWFTTHWRFVTIDVRTGTVSHETTWYNASSRALCFFPPELSSPAKSTRKEGPQSLRL
ncbi:hypothetical protein QOT17_010531 [Balamuthia mandrillaris]